MEKKSIFSVVAVVAVLLIAAMVIPMVKSANDDMGYNYTPNTVVLDSESISDPFLDNIQTMSESLSGEYGYDSLGNLTYDASLRMGEIFPDAPESIGDVWVDLTTTLLPDGIPTVAYNIRSDTFDISLDYAILYDESGNPEDAVFTYEGQTISLRESYDSFEDCSLTVLAVIYLGSMVVMMVCVAVAATYLNNQPLVDLKAINQSLISAAVKFYASLFPRDDYVPSLPEKVIWNDVVDGISYLDDKGKLIAVCVYGDIYSVEMLYRGTGVLNEPYYYAILYNKVVYIVPRAIWKNTAEAIMALDKNPGGMHSIWARSGNLAQGVASVLGPTDPPEIDSAAKTQRGYYKHYHTHNRMTNAHAFFGNPS